MQTEIWSRSRLKLLSGALAILAAMMLAPHLIATRSGAYRLAVETAQKNPEFITVLGDPVKEAWFSEGTLSFGSPRGAELQIPVHGRLRRGELEVSAIKCNGEWRLSALTLKLTDSPERINLLEHEEDR